MDIRFVTIQLNMKYPVAESNLLIVALFVTLVIFTATAAAQKITAYPDKDGSKLLSIAKAKPNLPTKIETDGAGNSTLKISPDKTFKAYVLCVPAESANTDYCAGRVFFTEQATKTVYEIRGEDTLEETGRPVDNIKWLNGHTLSYERWAGPHGGERYVIDVKSRKQTAAFFISDQPK
jgi:hypothetical protein